MKYFLFFAFFLINEMGLAQTISTIAGGGPRNLQALQTGLPLPAGVAIDSSGNLFISLNQSNQIWKINSSGQVNVYAGNGSYPFDSDGIAAVSATLYQPTSILLDPSGNLYFSDTGHNRVRKISTGGTITTVAGTGSATFGGDGGPATSAMLNTPLGIARDSAGNIYIADQGNNRVRMVTPGGTISTIAGTGTAGYNGEGPATGATLSGPNSVAVDSAGNIYISDRGNFRVRKIVSGTITTFAGTGTPGYTGDGGPPGMATLVNINGVAVDSSNNVYILESGDIRFVSGGTGNITTFAGSSTQGYSGDGGSPTSARFASISALAADATAANLYIVDSGNYRIRKIASNTVTTFAGNGSIDANGNGQAATNASFLTPNTVAVDNAGSLFFSDAGDSSIRKVTLSSGLLSTVAGTGIPGSTVDGGAATGPLTNPFAITTDSAGNIYFAEGDRVRKLSGGVYSTVANTSNTSGFAGDGGAATAAQFHAPSGLAVAANGDLYVADSLNYRIRKIDGSTGVVTTVAGNGTLASTGDGGLGVNAALNYPTSVALDGAGFLYIGELSSNRVRKLELSTNLISAAAGNSTTTNYADGVTATSTGLLAPMSLFADQSSNLFIADQGHSRVRKVTAGTNIISTVAGNGVYDFSGDGGSPTAAAVNPLGITIDRSQNLYIADSSGRVRTTQVMACFFTFSSPTVYVNSSSSTGSITVTATNSSCPYTVSSGSSFVTITSGASGTGSGTITFSVSADTGQNRTATVLVGGASFTIAQAGKLGQYNVGYYLPSYPLYALDSNGNGVADSADKSFLFGGQPGAIAVVGDWNGDGRTKVGFYLNGFWQLDYDGDGVFTSADKFYGYGSSDPSYIPVVGDWTGDGKTKIGFYHNGFWALDLNGNGQYDSGDGFYGFGNTGAIPVVGDWNGDKRTKIGFYYNGIWLLDYDGDGSNTSADKFYTNFYAYQSGDKPVVGDWNGDGKTKIGVNRSGFWVLDYNGDGNYTYGVDKFYGFGGNPGEIPLVGDWNGDGRSKVGFYYNGFWQLDFNGNGSFDGVAGGDRFIGYYAGSGTQPIIGRW